MKVLVVEDDPGVREAVERIMRLDGHDVELAGDGLQALQRLRSGPQPDVVVLDVLMPELDGLQVCRRMRADGNRTPVLMLTAAAEVRDRVAGLDAGADDYLTKPFAVEELSARVRSLLRRWGWDDGAVLEFADLRLDPKAHEVWRGSTLLEVTRTEFLLLELFLRHPRQVLTPPQIFDHVWGYDFGPASNSLQVYVGYLRRKTEAQGQPRLLHTIRGVGYVLRDARP